MTVLSNVINTQIALHKKFGGVVPEVASRRHIETIDAVIDEALEEANVTFDDIDAIAVTYGPGLVGALLVGVSTAKALAFALNKPLVPVHHIKGHIMANFVAHKDLEPPFVCLVASGGHSHIVSVEDYTHLEIMGRTRDDAAGEAPSVFVESSFNCFKFSSDMSKRPSASSVLWTSSRFRRYQIKSVTNWPNSRPWITISSNCVIQSLVRPSITALNMLLNTPESTAPRTSSTFS